MEKKIIRSFYTVFVLLSLINIFIYFTKDVLPDSFFEISSINTVTSYSSYYFGTLIHFLIYWSGLWTVPFLCFMFLMFHLSNTFGFSSFKKFSLILIFFIFIVLFFHFFFPRKLGEGIHSYISLNINDNLVLFFQFLSLLSFALLIISPEKIKNLLSSFISLNSIKFKKIPVTIPSVPFRHFLPAIAKPNFSVLKKSTPTSADSTFDKILNPANKVSFKSLNTSVEEEPSIESINKSDNEDFNQAILKKHRDKFSEVTSENKFFDMDDLISCITPKSISKNLADPDGNYFETIARSIEQKLEQFNITAEVINVLKGPVVDTFELELGAGVKVTGVTNRTDDLSLALMGAPIRMVYPMKGKSTIGIEVPRNPRDVIYLDDVLKSKEFNNSNYKLPVAMGKDAYGDPAVIDLAATPHLLVAGTTGAGKSVFVNTLLVSLIIKFSPKQLRLIMLDPKQLELALYQNLPHLVMPVVTDPEMASAALLWAIDEMERRYSLLKDFGVKNIDGFNKKILTLDKSQKYKIAKYYEDAEIEQFELPYIVIVVDEFADLMLSKSGKAIETSISRLAAKARASGLHIVLATQRPSTDIITGVIKANFPTRVSFRVFTNIDSRVILDGIGAEKLLGKGDMLFKQGIDILRMHSAFINEEEIESLVEKLSLLPTQYDNGAMEYLENSEISSISGDVSSDGDFGDGSKDEKYEEAVNCVAMHRVASASFIQRRLGVGYNRAANLIEEMERNGIVGPAQGSKPRKVLVPPPADS